MINIHPPANVCGDGLGCYAHRNVLNIPMRVISPLLDFDGVRADSAELLHCKNFVFHVSLFLFYRKAFVLVVKQIITTYTARKGTTSQIYSKKQVWIFEN